MSPRSHSGGYSLLPSPGVQAYWDSKATPRFSLLDHLSTRGSAQELTAARRAVDDELSALHAVMSRMRSRRNDFSLIARLPPEILSSIFAFHAINRPSLGSDFRYYYDDHDSPDRDHTHNYDHLYPSLPSDRSPARFRLGWITVTHVCRHWRQVALSNPNLWNTILFDLGAEWAEEMLARSKTAPISYHRSHWQSFQPRIPKGKTLDDEVILREHLSHIRQLTLSGDADFLAPAIRALTTPAPDLESLELLWNGLRSRESCVVLPSGIFSHQAPKLRHIVLAGCSIPWDSSVFRDLTHLDVSLPPLVPFPEAAAPQPGPLTIPSLDRLLSILEAMPSLQVLTLENCLPLPSFTNRVVPLQHLTRLYLEGSLPETVAVLERVSLPGSASLSLRCPHHNPLDGSLDALIGYLTTHFRAPGQSIPPISTLTIEYGECLTIGAWNTDVSSHQAEFPPVATPRLLLNLGCRHHALFDLLPLQLCKALPLRNLRAFATICPLLPWTPAEWAEVSSLCPQVAHLLVDGPAAVALAPTLMENTTFPALVALAFKFVDLPGNEDPGSLYIALPTLLRKRRAAGIPVRRLELEQCTADGMLLHIFSHLVDDFICDKNGEKYTDSDFLGSASGFSSEWDV